MIEAATVRENLPDAPTGTGDLYAERPTAQAGKK